MIVKCPKCNGPLLHDALTQKMKCEFCGEYFDPDSSPKENHIDLANPLKDDQARRLEELIASGRYDLLDQVINEVSDQVEKEASGFNDSNLFRDLEEMEQNEYVCTACGARLTLDQSESSTFCPYCGQPTIVFDRVSIGYKPKFILPFSVTSDNAKEIFHKEDTMRHLEIETICGVYIPYWLCDVSYADAMNFSKQVSGIFRHKTIYFYRKAESLFEHIMISASSKFEEAVSKAIGPYDMKQLKPFHTDYLSGYYSDCYDLPKSEIEHRALLTARLLFENELMKTIPENTPLIASSAARAKVNQINYSLLPVWFIRYKKDDTLYTMYINGQTGKIVRDRDFTEPLRFSDFSTRPLHVIDRFDNMDFEIIPDDF